jgi:UDP-N-acetylglucosamine 2-epimerase
LSTLLGLYLAKTASLKTALVEAGLSSGNLFDPFPEEWIRRHTGRKVDFLFPPDNISESWLKLRKFQCPIINTKYNTGRDSLSLIISRHSLNAGELESDGKFGVVTLHRLETLSYKPRLVRAIRHILSLARELGPLKFYMHPPTTNAMKKHGLMNEIESSAHIELHGLEPYPQFIESLMKARFILTDGGSIQEEATYLMKPCLLLRNRTERSDGVGYNASLASWDTEEDVAFLRKKIDELSQPLYRDSGMYASRIILKSIDKFRLQSNT